MNSNDLIRCNNIEDEHTRDQCYYKLFAEQLPLCEFTHQKENPKIHKIEDLVENCTTESHTGVTANKIGGATPMYKLATGNKLIDWFSELYFHGLTHGDQSFDPEQISNDYVGTGDPSFSKTYICKENIGDDRWIVHYHFVGTTSYIQRPPQTIIAITKWLQSNLIDYYIYDENYHDYNYSSDYGYSNGWYRHTPAGLYCGKSEFCLHPDKWYGRSDDKDYIVMGGIHGDNLFDHGREYYVINNKLYDPHTEYSSQNINNETRWMVGGIKENKAIVHKMINILTDDHQPIENIWFANTFTLKTCEILLTTLL